MTIQRFPAVLLISSALIAPVATAQTSLQPNYIRTVQAESSTNNSGVTVNGNHLADINGGDWFAINSGNLGAGSDLSILRYAKGDTSEIGFEIRKGSLNGPIIASGDLAATNSATSYQNFNAPITDVGGTNDLFVRFTGIGTIDRVDRLQFARAQRRLMHAENASAFGDVVVEPTYISYVDEGDWIRFDDVNFGDGFTQLLARYSRGNEGNSTVSVHLDDPANPSIGEMTLIPTGSWTTWRNRAATIATAEGLHDVYFNFSGGEGVGDFNYFMLRHQPLTTELPVSEADQINNMSYFGSGNQYVGDFGANPWMRFYRTSVSYNPDISITYATQDPGMAVEVRRGNQSGRLLATIDLPSTGGWDTYQTVSGNLSNTPQGMYHLTFKFVGGGGVNVESFTLDRLGGDAVAVPSHEEFHGDEGNNEFDGFLTGQRAFFGYGGTDDKVLYEGFRINYTFEEQTNGQVHATKPDGSYDVLDSIEGVWFIDEAIWYNMEDLLGGSGPTHEEFQGTSGDDVFNGSLTIQRAFYGNGGTDQVNYEGFRTDYTFELQANGQVFAIKADGSYDILDGMVGVWFLDESIWYNMEDLLGGSEPTHEEFQGTTGDDVFNGSLTIQRAFYGNGGTDQVNYEGFRADYTFELQASGQVFAIKADGSYDILDGMVGVWFLDEAIWYNMEDLLVPPAGGLTADDVDFFAFAGQSNAEGHFYEGSPTGSQEFESRIQALTGFETTTINAALGGSGSNENVYTPPYTYWWDLGAGAPGPALNSAITTINNALSGGEDLDGIIWAQGETDAYSIYFGGDPTFNENNLITATNNIFQTFRSNYGANLPILIQELGEFPTPTDATVTTIDGFGIMRNAQQGIIDSDANTYFGADTGGLALRDDLHFNAVSYRTIADRLANTAVNVVDQGGGVGSTDEIVHYGEPVNLVGANLAWSENSRFSTDIGTPTMNLQGFRDRFDEVQAAGGNSVRIWLHTTAQVTPEIQTNGIVTGLSRQVDNQTVINQVDSILDEAWDRGLLVTFSLFSFDMMCDTYGDDFGYTGVWQLESHRTMLENEYQSYIDNALIPMVTGVKDHPALLAWEVFNEPEGMIYDPGGSTQIEQAFHFCQDGALTYPLSLQGAQRFVNQVAAAIHQVDPNVKVTTSTHTDFFNEFSNSTLTSMGGANPNGTLDFYELHYYNNWTNAPYYTNVDTYGADRPVIIGEYSLDHAVNDGQNATTSISTILDQGYAGAWPWSLTGGSVGAIQGAISDVTPVRRALDQTAVEACINTQNSTCYNQ